MAFNQQNRQIKELSEYAKEKVAYHRTKRTQQWCRNSGAVAVDDITAAGEKWVTRKVYLFLKLIGPIESSHRGDEENGITLFDW